MWVPRVFGTDDPCQSKLWHAKERQCSIAMSAKQRSKFEALHRWGWRLHLIEKFRVGCHRPQITNKLCHFTYIIYPNSNIGKRCLKYLFCFNTVMLLLHVLTNVSTASGTLNRMAKFVKWLQVQTTWELVYFSRTSGNIPDTVTIKNYCYNKKNILLRQNSYKLVTLNHVLLFSSS